MPIQSVKSTGIQNFRNSKKYSKCSKWCPFNRCHNHTAWRLDTKNSLFFCHMQSTAWTPNLFSLSALSQLRIIAPPTLNVVSCNPSISGWQVTVCSNLMKPGKSGSSCFHFWTWNSTRKHDDCNQKNDMNRCTRRRTSHISKESKPTVSID